MDAETFVEVYKPLIVVAFYIAVLNWLGYTVLAPWFKSALGRVIWTKFLANVLILLVPYLQIMNNGLPFRYELSIITLIFFIFALLVVGFGIYTTQIQGYITYRAQLRASKKLIKEEENK